MAAIDRAVVAVSARMFGHLPYAGTSCSAGIGKRKEAPNETPIRALPWRFGSIEDHAAQARAGQLKTDPRVRCCAPHGTDVPARCELARKMCFCSMFSDMMKAFVRFSRDSFCGWDVTL